MTLVYTHNPSDREGVTRFFKDNLVKFRELRRLIISPDKTEISDINGDKMIFEGLTYGDPALEDLMKINYVFFDASTLHNPDATPNKIKEFSLSARYPWGHDRIL